MKIFLVKRTDSTGWDEYDSFVIVADSKEEAIKLADGEEKNAKGWIAKEVIADALRIVLSSFNAG